MTRSGKKALLDAAEEAKQRNIEEEAKEKEERRQRCALFSSNPVAEETSDPTQYYWIPTSQSEKKRLTTAANSIFKLAQKFEDDNEDVLPSMLVLARDSLPAALKILRMPANWPMSTELDGDYDNVKNTMKMLCSLAPSAGVRLSRDEIFDIWAITILLCIADCNDCWWEDYGREEYEDLIGECFLSEGIAVLAEIAQQDGPRRGMLCYDFLSRIVNNDSSADDLLRICAVYTHVLCDPRSEASTNGMVYAGIFDISNQLRWAQILCDNLVEPARKVAVDDKVDTICNCECDFPQLLLRLSKALAEAKAQAAAGLTYDQLGCLDDTCDNELPTSEEWSFFLEIFRRNSDGIKMCDCPVKEPQLLW